MSVEHGPSPEEMGVQQEPVLAEAAQNPDTVKATPNVVDIRNRMAELQAKVKEAQEQKKQEVERKVTEKTEELAENYVKGSTLETAKQELEYDLIHTEQQLQEFEQVLQQATALGMPVKEYYGFFLEAFNAQKEKLADLQHQQEDLISGARDIASNPKVLGTLQEVAEAEDR